MSLSGLGVQAPTGTVTIAQSDPATDEARSRLCHYQHAAIVLELKLVFLKIFI